MNGFATLTSSAACWHDGAQVSEGPTTHQRNWWCPACGATRTTFPGDSAEAHFTARTARSQAPAVAHDHAAAMRQALEALETVEPYADQLTDYSSTAAEWPLNLLPRKVVTAIAALRVSLAAPPLDERGIAEKCAAICTEMEAGYKEVRDQIGEPVMGCVYSHLADGAQVCAAEIRERFGISGPESDVPVQHKEGA